VRPARIGIDAHVLDGKYQGTRTWLVEILRRAPDLAPELTFVVYTADPANADRLLEGARIEHRVLPEQGAIGRNLRYWPGALRRDHLDLVVTQYFSPPRDPQRQLVVIHDVLFETYPQFFPWRTRWRNRLLVGWSARRAGAVATVSEYSRREIARRYRRPVDRISLVHNGVDPAQAAASTGRLPAGVPPATRFALFVGRLEPRKNLRTALAAWRHVADADARLVVVGRDDFEEPATLVALAAEPRAIHLADVPQDELWELYRRATVLVFPSLGEGWGIPVLEALASGTPVVASRSTAIPEAGGQVSTYFDAEAADAPQVLARLITDAFAGNLPFDEAAALGHVARFSWDASAKEFVAAVREALE
jgi:glycosyltransferase involved in cell wall biosynthesis